MDVTPGFKQTEVGVIPDDWSVRRIGDVCGFIVPGRNKPRLFDGEIPWITTPDLEDGRSVSASRIGLCVTRAEAKSIGSRVVPVGSVLMSCAGDLGITAIARNEIVINQQLHAFLPSSHINEVYLLNVISSQKPQIAGSATKTAVPYLNKNNCNSILIPVPPVAEQEAIAQALRDADALIESLEQLLAKKRHIKQGAMQELLTGKMRLPGFNGKWKTLRLGEFAPLQRGFDLPASRLKSGPYPVIYSNGILNYHSRYQVLGPGVVTGRSGTIGSVQFIEQHYWPHNTTLWVTNFKGNAPKFIFYLYSFIDFSRFGTGSGVPTLNRNDVHAHAAYVPLDYEEQTAIAATLSDMDQEITAQKARLVKACQLKQGMMQELLTGRIRLV